MEFQASRLINNHPLNYSGIASLEDLESREWKELFNQLEIIQQKAPSLGKPVLVMREVTERPKAVEAGTARLVGRDATRVFRSVSKLLTDSRAYAAMAQRRTPYGGGRASSSSRIIAILRNQLKPTWRDAPEPGAGVVKPGLRSA